MIVISGAVSTSQVYIAIILLFMGVQQVLTGAFRGAGDTFVAMVLAIVTLWMLQFPLSYALSKHTTLAENGNMVGFPCDKYRCSSHICCILPQGQLERTQDDRGDQNHRTDN